MQTQKKLTGQILQWNPTVQEVVHKEVTHQKQKLVVVEEVLVKKVLTEVQEENVQRATAMKLENIAIVLVQEIDRKVINGQDQEQEVDRDHALDLDTGHIQEVLEVREDRKTGDGTFTYYINVN